MHFIDILFIAAGLFFVAIGIRRGLIGELFRLLALVAGFFAAFLYGPDLGRAFTFAPAHLANALAFTIIFVITVLIIIGAGWMLRKAVHLTPLGWVDYLCGGTIGLAKTALIFWVICLSLSSFPPPRFKKDLNRSLVFQAYKKLPPAVKLARMTQARDLFRKSVDRDLPKKARRGKHRIERLKDRIDSVRQPDINYR